MFWKRATGHGAFFGLVTGTLAAALNHGLTLPEGAGAGIKGGWITVMHTYPSEMAQNFWSAIVAWTACFIATILISLATTPRPEGELVGLVYSLTPRPQDEHLAWYQRPLTLGLVVLFVALILNVVFW
jgi:SSS family solute:Na+ symporter